MGENASAKVNRNQSRRSFIRFVSLATLAGTFATAVAAAIRFLRPLSRAANSKWLDVGPIAQIAGDTPIARKVVTEQVAGWAKTLEEHLVYILPAKNHQILSAVCPHEGCEVAWRADERVFACPCHESNFAEDGQRINGPAPRGLDTLPSRIENGKLQVQFQFFANNTQERISRG